MKRAAIALERKRELDAVIREADRIGEIEKQITADWSDGKANIHVYVDEPYHPLSGKTQLDDSLFAYMESQANLLPSLVPIRVILHGVPEMEQETVSKLMREHYQTVMQDQLWDKHSSQRRMLYLTLIGTAFLGVYLLLALNREDSLFLEILSVIGSFSLWEAANCFLLERREIRRSLQETAQFITAEIAFASAEE